MDRWWHCEVILPLCEITCRFLNILKVYLTYDTAIPPVEYTYQGTLKSPQGCLHVCVHSTIIHSQTSGVTQEPTYERMNKTWSVLIIKCYS